MFDAVIRAARTQIERHSTWRHLEQHTSGLLQKTSPRAIVLASPYIRWGWLADGDLVQRWVEAVSALSYTENEEVAPSVVDTLLQTASPYIPIKIWLWLTKLPDPLPI